MKIQENISLAPYTTFQVGGRATFLCAAESEDDVREAIAFAKARALPLFVLGGGSNLLVSDAGFAGLVIKMELKGMEFRGDSVVVAAGENWDEFVAETVSRGLWGVENLSGIPGTVGASPVQNIGAYGTEVMSAVESVRAINRKTGEIRQFSNTECRFSYRDSFFKTVAGKKWIITSVTFRLSSAPRPNLSYKDLAEHFAGRAPSQSEIREAVIAIRKNKFPDLAKIGTAGSFWKNPIISKEKFAELSKQYPGMPSFPAPNDQIKVPLAWILDKVCGLKGYKSASLHGAPGTALFEKQALILVAERGATTRQIEAFAAHIGALVREKTDIEIEPEVVKI